ISKSQVSNTVKLLEEGATIPFISRYRKEASGSLDETEVTAIEKEWKRLLELFNLYNEIQNCHICPKMEPYKELRNPFAVNEKTKVFIISQALAEKQLRFSGINFFQLDGVLGNTGKQLEKFLNLFNQTVFPSHEIVLKNGAAIPKSNDNLLPVYNTEITQCFPGKGIKGDRKPDSLEVKNCLGRSFLLNEIKITKPKLLLLIGRLSINTFYKFIFGFEEKRSTNKIIDDIVNKSVIPEYDMNGLKIGVLPIQHASGLNPQYNVMLKNISLINLIKEFINE
ncbi:MAG TPA: Tex-like N-terminal domain-containing protein, partial [Ignavibacteriaceae bacterium]|nr:Tex-like N-terminal domain-containing protein [Ignavibacteriaceae bacterium]